MHWTPKELRMSALVLRMTLFHCRNLNFQVPVQLLSERCSVAGRRADIYRHVPGRLRFEIPDASLSSGTLEFYSLKFNTPPGSERKPGNFGMMFLISNGFVYLTSTFTSTLLLSCPMSTSPPGVQPVAHGRGNVKWRLGSIKRVLVNAHILDCTKHAKDTAVKTRAYPLTLNDNGEERPIYNFKNAKQFLSVMRDAFVGAYP